MLELLPLALLLRLRAATGETAWPLSVAGVFDARDAAAKGGDGADCAGAAGLGLLQGLDPPLGAVLCGSAPLEDEEATAATFESKMLSRSNAHPGHGSPHPHREAAGDEHSK